MSFIRTTSKNVLAALGCMTSVVLAGVIVWLFTEEIDVDNSLPPPSFAPSSPSPPAPLPTASFNNFVFELDSGMSELPESIKNQTYVVHDCFDVNQVPRVRLADVGSSYFDNERMLIFINIRDAANIMYLLLHEYVHFLDYLFYNGSYPCARDLASNVQYLNETWGDNNGFPYCYTGDLNSREYLALLVQGYCTGKCGPTRSYLEDFSNPVASQQYNCVKNFESVA